MYFYTQVDSPLAKECLMTNEELLEEPGKHVDVSEDILEVMYCTNPLYWWQLFKGAVKPTGLENLQGTMHHAYIVFQTKYWWWSIEKNEECVTLQRSIKIEFVRDKYRKVRRQESFTTGIGCEKKKMARSKTIKQLFEHIHQGGYVNEVLNNPFPGKISQDFADSLYEFF